MSEAGPARFAEYNSMTSSGTTIDLSSRKTTFGDGHENNPRLTTDEAAFYTVTMYSEVMTTGIRQNIPNRHPLLPM